MLPPPLRGLSVAALLSVACQEAPPAPLETPGAGAPPDADAATLTIPLAPPSSARPLPRFRHRCEDQRYPALAGPWLLGCGPGGKLDLAEHVRTGQVVALDSAASSAGLAEGSLFAVGRDLGLWTLPDPAPQQPATMVSHPPIAPPALQGPGVAVLSEGRVTLFLTGSAQMLSRPAHPLPWFPPALVWPEVYWVDAGQQERSGLDIWAWTHGAGPPRPGGGGGGGPRPPPAAQRRGGGVGGRGGGGRAGWAGWTTAACGSATTTAASAGTTPATPASVRACPSTALWHAGRNETKETSTCAARTGSRLAVRETRAGPAAGGTGCWCAATGGPG